MLVDFPTESLEFVILNLESVQENDWDSILDELTRVFLELGLR
jgi:hypothetical protein